MNRFGKYDLLARLATGGMAEIWLARIPRTDGLARLVVVKRLLRSIASNPDSVEMFLDEARINARLHHPNVAHVSELGQVDGRYFMVMEYVPGLTVTQLGRSTVKRLGEVPAAVACGVVAQACAGLHHAHECTQPDGTPLQIVHRDVSPSNLILDFDGVVKVVDFGIAKAVGRIVDTAAGMVKGKTGYLSPEQCSGAPLDRRTDVFALGVVLWELLTSRRLFKRPDPLDAYDAIAGGPIPDPTVFSPSLHPAIAAVAMHALARPLDERFASADQMHTALLGAMETASLAGTPADLRRFLESNLPDLIAEQRKLAADAQAGRVGSTDPMLKALPDGTPEDLSEPTELMPRLAADRDPPRLPHDEPPHLDTRPTPMIRKPRRLRNLLAALFLILLVVALLRVLL